MSVQSVSEGRDTRHGQYYRRVGLSSPGTGDNGARLAAMLADPNWRPTREQVADLIARALRLGREWAMDEIMSRPWETPRPFDARALSAAQRQQARRAEWDRAARLAREGDHPGGAVKAW